MDMGLCWFVVDLGQCGLIVDPNIDMMDRFAGMAFKLYFYGKGISNDTIRAVGLMDMGMVFINACWFIILTSEYRHHAKGNHQYKKVFHLFKVRISELIVTRAVGQAGLRHQNMCRTSAIHIEMCKARF